MRDLAKLIEFLTHTMTMMTVYQPAVILQVLAQEGVASRTELARMLSGNEAWESEFWDQVLTDNPKRWLVGKHQILKYDPETQTFFLNFELTDTAAVEQAKAICEQEIEAWIQKAFSSGKITEVEGWRLYRVLEIARRGNPDPWLNLSSSQAAIVMPEIQAQIEEFAMRAAVRELRQRYPGEKVTQQPYNNPGFDVLVGTLANPIAYVRVKATQGYQPTFYLSEAERQFSIDHADCYLLAIVYAIQLYEETYKIALQPGRIDLSIFKLTPMVWQGKLLTVDPASEPASIRHLS